MQFRGGINELMRQAARIQRKVDQAKAELADREVTASAMGDKVKATVTLGRKVNRIEIDPAAHNARAIRCYESVGFRPIGRARRREKAADGTWHDSLLMDLVAEELH